MKQFLLTIIMMLISLGMAEAKVLTPDEALAKALSTLQGGSSRAKAKAKTAAKAMLHKTVKSDDNTPLCYVFTTPDGGYIIAGADDRATNVLGYVDDCTYEESMQIPAFREWFEGCKGAMTWLSQQAEEGTKTKTKTKTLTKSSVSSDIKEYVEPLLGEIKWGQSPIFNDLCPIDTVTHQLSVAGCCATAVAQIMDYWKWPKHAAEIAHTNTNFPTQYVNFKDSEYDWENMLDSYNDTVNVKITPEQKYAVAKLTADIGCALDMAYNSEGSIAQQYDPLKALPIYFKYSTAIRCCTRDFYTPEAWDSLLKTELSAERPVLMQAYTDGGDGHAFVVDGYNTDGLYHINWGWNGKSNSYFCIDYMLPASQGTGGGSGAYCANQAVTIDILPDTAEIEKKHNLHVVGFIKYEKTDDTFNFIVINDTYTKFYGKVVLALMSPEAKALATVIKDYSTNPLFGLNKDVLSMGPISSATYQEGSRIIPFYYESDGTGPFIIPSAVSLRDGLTYTNNVWNYDNTPVPYVVSIDTVQAYIHSIPKFKATFKCPESNSNGLYSTVMASVRQDVNGLKYKYCYGLGQLHIKTGETQTIDFSCSHLINTVLNYRTLKPGDYTLLLEVTLDGMHDYQTITETPFTMQDDGEPIVSLKDSTIVLDKEFYAPGDSITATAVLNNKGGYYEDIYALYLADAQSANKTILSNSKKQVAALRNSSQELTYYMTAPTTPGKYILLVVGNDILGNAKALTREIYFEVKESGTGITDVTNADSQVQDAMMYDMQGRRITSPRHGQLIICGGKKTVIR